MCPDCIATPDAPRKRSRKTHDRVSDGNQGQDWDDCKNPKFRIHRLIPNIR